MALSDNVADKVSIMGGPAIDLVLILQQIINYVSVLFSISEHIFFFLNSYQLKSERKFSKKERTNDLYDVLNN